MRCATRFLLVVTALAAAVLPAAGAIQTIPLNDTRSHLTLIDQQLDAMRFEVAVGELVAMPIDTPEGPFTRLLIPGFHSSKTEGAPELPMMNRLIEVPYGATARVTVTPTRTRSYTLAELGIHVPLFPAQPPMPKSADPATWPFVYDAAAYRAARVAQEPAAVEPIGRLRAVNIGRLEVSPVEYYPNEGRIVVHERLEVEVTFVGADHAAGDLLKARTHSPFFDVVYGQIEGYRGIHDQYPDLVRDVVTLVVVAPQQFAAQMQPYVEWKKARGFHTILGVTGVDMGTTKEAIQAWLLNLYNNPPDGLPAPSFVVFVGDVAEMPTFLQSGDCTDRPYCSTDGDLMPEMYYGRLSASNPTHLQNILDKTLMYDQFTMSDPSYLGKAVMIAGMDSSFGSTWANGQINYGTTYYFNAAHNIYSYTHLYPQSGSQDAQIVQEVSDGVAYVNYTAHGSQTSWSDPTFTQANVNGLQNNQEYCLAVGNCCLTSDYDYSSECFAETWIRAANKGAIGYIGGSNSTYWDEDYWWGVGYTANIIANPTFEGTQKGAYDGLFHDHGEAMEQWYVTNDAIIFCGNLAVTESGSSRITYYWNIYNLMGDPSLSTYLGVPTPNPVQVPQTVFTTWTSLTVGAVPGSYIGLTQNGEIVGAGTVGTTGSVEIPFLTQPTPGPLHIVVMAQNREPYVDDLNVIVPATVYIDPQAIDAGVSTPVSVGVFEYDGITPKPGVEVWASGLGYETPHAVTDGTGYCTITIEYPYGPTIDIVGKVPADPYELFRIPLDVIADRLFGAGLSVTTEIGLNNAFALNLPGTLHATVSEPGHTLWAVLNGQVLGTTDQFELTVTPAELGTVTGIIAVPGYDLFQRGFDVIEAYGTLSGHVDAAGSPGSGAVVRGYDGLGEMVFEVTANASGDYTVPDEILVAPYTVTCDLFGYLHWEEAYFVNYGANVLDIDLNAAPAGLLSGVITDAQSGDPLEATIRVYRSDTGALYAETTSSGMTGAYQVGPLPYFEYDVQLRAWHHMPQTVAVVVDEPNEVRDFALEPTNGTLLLIDDTAKGEAPAKVDPATGEVLAPGFAYDEKDLQTIVTELEGLGYAVETTTMTGTNPAEWANYDLLMTCSGNNTTTLNNTTFRNNLITYVQNGGRLLIEGGEVGYDHYGSGTFASVVMRTNDWNHDQSGSVTVAMPNHYVMSHPNPITGPITVGYSGYGDHDAMVPTNGGVRVGSWTTYPSDASLICYDDEPGGEMGGQIVFFCFCYTSMSSPTRIDLLQNAVTWLLTPDLDPTGVEASETPASLALRSIRPNPAAGAASIAFDLPSAGTVDLAVYDVAGRRIATLLQGALPAGTHQAVWSGTEQNGRPVASGVYFARLEAEGRVLVRKMMRIE